MPEDHDPNAEPHRPPKYVEGVYKPHRVSPEADYVIFVWPLDYAQEPHVADVDDDGYVRHRDTGKPMTEGGSNIAGYIDDGTIVLRGVYAEMLDAADVTVPDE